VEGSKSPDSAIKRFLGSEFCFSCRLLLGTACYGFCWFVCCPLCC
jgi:hypothetical protein